MSLEINCVGFITLPLQPYLCIFTCKFKNFQTNNFHYFESCLKVIESFALCCHLVLSAFSAMTVSIYKTNTIYYPNK